MKISALNKEHRNVPHPTMVPALSLDETIDGE
jgi:hypothetical protein